MAGPKAGSSSPSLHGSSASCSPSKARPMLDTLTRKDRETLVTMIKRRERVVKSAFKARSADLIAAFEAQLDRRYSVHEDEVWDEASIAAQRLCRKAELKIASRCRELGIPAEFAPALSVNWWSRGPDALAAQRRAMLQFAKQRIQQVEAEARLAIETASLHAQEQLCAAGLTTEAARAFLEGMPTVEGLMPTISVDVVQAQLAQQKALCDGSSFDDSPFTVCDDYDWS